MHSLHDLYESIAAAMSGAFAGRATWYSIRIQEGKRHFLDRFVIVDLIIAGTMGIIGLAIGDYYQLPLTAIVGISAVLAYLGPRGLQYAVARYLEFRKGPDRHD